MRTCGSCGVCCIHPIIKGFPDGHVKRPGEICRHLSTRATERCDVFATDARPPVCSAYVCGWLYGYGGPDDSPDKTGVLLSVKLTTHGLWVFCEELEAGAARGKGRDIIIDAASRGSSPIIVIDYHTPAPGDVGDYLVVKTEYLERTKKLMGAFMGYLDDNSEYGIYELTLPYDRESLYGNT